MILKEVQVEGSNAKTQVAFHNMRYAENSFSLDFFLCGSHCYFKANPTKNYQDLEKELRQRGFQSHVIARQYNPPSGVKLCLINDSNIECEYEGIISCRPYADAIKELLLHSHSYEENFNKLNRAGCLVSLTDSQHVPFSKSDDVYKEFSNKQISDMEKLISGKYELHEEELDIDSFIQSIMSECIKKYGKEPVLIRIGTEINGDQIMGFILDNKVASMYTVIYSCDKNGLLTKKISII
jgi:hypothetical protein